MVLFSRILLAAAGLVTTSLAVSVVVPNALAIDDESVPIANDTITRSAFDLRANGLKKLKARYTPTGYIGIIAGSIMDNSLYQAITSSSNYGMPGESLWDSLMDWGWLARGKELSDADFDFLFDVHVHREVLKGVYWSVQAGANYAQDFGFVLLLPLQYQNDAGTARFVKVLQAWLHYYGTDANFQLRLDSSWAVRAIEASWPVNPPNPPGKMRRGGVQARAADTCPAHYDVWGLESTEERDAWEIYKSADLCRNDRACPSFPTCKTLLSS